jgi:hypothetical protein
MSHKMTRMANRFERLEISIRNNNDRTISAEDVHIPQRQRRTLMQLKGRTCRWPVGDPGDSSFFFCGGVTERGQAYCPIHHARASYAVPLAPIKLQPPQDRTW